MASSSDVFEEQGRVYVRIGVGVDVVVVGSDEVGSGTVCDIKGPMANAMC